MTSALRVLLVEDSEADALLVLRALRGGGFDPSHARVETAEAMRAALREQWDIVLCDYSLPEFDGLQALCLLREAPVAASAPHDESIGGHRALAVR